MLSQPFQGSCAATDRAHVLWRSMSAQASAVVGVDVTQEVHGFAGRKGWVATKVVDNDTAWRTLA